MTTAPGIGKVVTYRRVSTDEQVKNFSLDAQLEVTRRYARDQGGQVVDFYAAIDKGSHIVPA